MQDFVCLLEYKSVYILAKTREKECKAQKIQAIVEHFSLWVMGWDFFPTTRLLKNHGLIYFIQKENPEFLSLSHQQAEKASQFLGSCACVYSERYLFMTDILRSRFSGPYMPQLWFKPTVPRCIIKEENIKHCNIFPTIRRKKHNKNIDNIEIWKFVFFNYHFQNSTCSLWKSGSCSPKTQICTALELVSLEDARGGWELNTKTTEIHLFIFVTYGCIWKE